MSRARNKTVGYKTFVFMYVIMFAKTWGGLARVNNALTIFQILG